MANDEHLKLLRQGVTIWNEWRERNPDIAPDLRQANLNRAHLSHADLSHAHLSEADLSRATLSHAYLHGANLFEADLSGADLTAAKLFDANLSAANLNAANLRAADLTVANLIAADFSEAVLWEVKLYASILSETNLSKASLFQTIFAAVDLTGTNGLNECDHPGSSVIDFRTLSLSKNLPIRFLRGCGLPDKLIEYLPSLRDEAIQFYSCFISYSSKDQVFANRLHADLQDKGVRCWFAPHDLPIGAKTWDAIDEAIRLRDKLLLILSKRSIESGWVEDEVNKAYAEERSRKEVVLFPVRIDNALMSTDEPWAVKLRDQRNIGDFRQWKNPAQYQNSLERLLRDLKTGRAE